MVARPGRAAIATEPASVFLDFLFLRDSELWMLNGNQLPFPRFPSPLAPMHRKWGLQLIDLIAGIHREPAANSFHYDLLCHRAFLTFESRIQDFSFDIEREELIEHLRASA